MKKPALLRAAIGALYPELARDPDRLAMWVEQGSVRATGTAQRGFAWEYQLTVVAEDFTREPEGLFFVVVDWLRSQQPDVIQPNAPGFPFEVDVLGDTTFDVKMTLPLREIVTATAVGEGGWQLAVVPEPLPLFPDAEPLRDASGPITSIWTRAGDGEAVQVAPIEAD